MIKKKPLFGIAETSEVMGAANSISAIELHENRVICMYASLLLFTGALVNYLCYGLLLHGKPLGILINSLFFVFLGVLFEALRRMSSDASVTSYSVSVLNSVTFLFVLFRFYRFLGPAVWLIACMQILFAMLSLRRRILFITGGTVIFAGLYVLFNQPVFYFRTGLLYLLPQFLLPVILVASAGAVYCLNSEKYFMLLNLINLLLRPKDEVNLANDETAAYREEMRAQNSKLFRCPRKIKENNEKLYNLVYFDKQTGLPNRNMFMEKLGFIIEKAAKQQENFYVIFLDIDSFKRINDTMGHYVGDRLLGMVAERLKSCIGEDDLLGRTGGDEFAIILKKCFDREEAFAEVEFMRNSFSQPVKIDNVEIRCTASFGVSTFPDDGEDVTQLLKCADISINKAKELGKNNTQFFKKYMQDEIEYKAVMERRLTHALNNNEFYLVFQPQYFATDLKLRGMEALVRWKSPELGEVNPVNFIAIAEETGLMVSLGLWILKTACMKFKELQERFGLEILITVNISAVQIKDGNFIDAVNNILDETELNPANLEIEVTETVFIETFDEAISLLKKLKKSGIRIALDDFGTGYSSLSYLRSLPIDTLKIDKSFINDLSREDNQVQIVGDIISLGHNLGVRIVAEGVEHEYQMRYLREHRCDYVQGYLYSKPLPEQDIIHKLETGGSLSDYGSLD